MESDVGLAQLHLSLSSTYPDSALHDNGPNSLQECIFRRDVLAQQVFLLYKQDRFKELMKSWDVILGVVIPNLATIVAEYNFERDVQSVDDDELELEAAGE